jgi:hypothetical protein
LVGWGGWWEPEGRQWGRCVWRGVANTITVTRQPLSSLLLERLHTTHLSCVADDGGGTYSILTPLGSLNALLKQSHGIFRFRVFASELVRPFFENFLEDFVWTTLVVAFANTHSGAGGRTEGVDSSILGGFKMPRRSEIRQWFVSVE